MNCPIHGENVPPHEHHVYPRYKGGSNHTANKRVLCAYCHRELHNHDAEMHRRGYHGLVMKVGDISAHRRALQSRGARRLKEELEEEEYRQYFRGLAMKRWHGEREEEHAA